MTVIDERHSMKIHHFIYYKYTINSINIIKFNFLLLIRIIIIMFVIDLQIKYIIDIWKRIYRQSLCT